MRLILTAQEPPPVQAAGQSGMTWQIWNRRGEKKENVYNLFNKQT
jgi:hypothetical protein